MNMTTNFLQSYIFLPSAGITSLYQQAWLWNPEDQTQCFIAPK